MKVINYVRLRSNCTGKTRIIKISKKRKKRDFLHVLQRVLGVGRKIDVKVPTRKRTKMKIAHSDIVFYRSYTNPTHQKLAHQSSKRDFWLKNHATTSEEILKREKVPKTKQKMTISYYTTSQVQNNTKNSEIQKQKEIPSIQQNAKKIPLSTENTIGIHQLKQETIPTETTRVPDQPRMSGRLSDSSEIVTSALYGIETDESTTLFKVSRVKTDKQKKSERNVSNEPNGTTTIGVKRSEKEFTKTGEITKHNRGKLKKHSLEIDRLATGKTVSVTKATDSRVNESNTTIPQIKTDIQLLNNQPTETDSQIPTQIARRDITPRVIESKDLIARKWTKQVTEQASKETRNTNKNTSWQTLEKSQAVTSSGKSLLNKKLIF